MKLFYTPMKGVLHKVQVVATEAGLYDRIERIYVNPYEMPAALHAVNPLSQVPALVTDDGTALYDGAVIYEYLDSLHSGPRIFPAAGPARWLALRRMALADGAFDAINLRQAERRRPAAQQSEEALRRYESRIVRALDAMEREADQFVGFDIGQIAITCTLINLDRLHRGGLYADWRERRPSLAAWLGRFTDRPSFRVRDEEVPA